MLGVKGFRFVQKEGRERVSAVTYLVDGTHFVALMRRDEFDLLERRVVAGEVFFDAAVDGFRIVVGSGARWGLGV